MYIFLKTKNIPLCYFVVKIGLIQCKKKISSIIRSLVYYLSFNEFFFYQAGKDLIFRGREIEPHVTREDKIFFTGTCVCCVCVCSSGVCVCVCARV